MKNIRFRNQAISLFECFTQQFDFCLLRHSVLNLTTRQKYTFCHQKPPNTWISEHRVLSSKALRIRLQKLGDEVFKITLGPTPPEEKRFSRGELTNQEETLG